MSLVIYNGVIYTARSANSTHTVHFHAKKVEYMSCEHKKKTVNIVINFVANGFYSSFYCSLISANKIKCHFFGRLSDLVC